MVLIFLSFFNFILGSLCSDYDGWSHVCYITRLTITMTVDMPVYKCIGILHCKSFYFFEVVKGGLAGGNHQAPTHAQGRGLPPHAKGVSMQVMKPWVDRCPILQWVSTNYPTAKLSLCSLVTYFIGINCGLLVSQRGGIAISISLDWIFKNL